jgi:hypothetical protein
MNMKQNRIRNQKIIVSGAIIKYPWGGLIQYWLGWLAGLKKLGFDVYYVEEVEWENACFDIQQLIMTDDPSYGIRVVKKELDRFGLGDKWCFVDHSNQYYGLDKVRVADLFKTAELFIDLEFDTFKELSVYPNIRVFIDGEPGWNQLGFLKMQEAGQKVPDYDFFFTQGLNVGTERSTAPSAGINWNRLICPILMDNEAPLPFVDGSGFSTVMKWQANPPVTYNGKTYGMKDLEFPKFLGLPKLVNDRLEIAVSGPNVPRDLLEVNGWIVKDGDKISTDVQSYRDYIGRSKGEFSVAKNVFVETNNGMFVERSGYYMANMRSVILQDTGWSEHLPTGRGLFAVRSLEEATEAINIASKDYKQHGKWACEIAHEFLDSDKVLGNLLKTVGIF